MQEVRCDTCRNRVMVEKYSPAHTSVQWLQDAEAACPEFARRAALGEHSKCLPTCVALRESIQQAVQSGKLRTDSERHEPVLGSLGSPIRKLLK